MQFVVDQLKLLGLNSREIRVFTAMSAFGQMKMAEIAFRANVPRSTAHSVVIRLAEQGLIDVFQVKRHKEYAVDLRKVTQKLNELELNLDPGALTHDQPLKMPRNSSFWHGNAISDTGRTDGRSAAHGSHETPGGDEVAAAERGAKGTEDPKRHDMELISGRERVFGLYRELLQLARTERVYIVQGSASAKHAVELMPENFMQWIHEEQKKRELILEGIISERMLAWFDTLSAEVLASHHGRLMIVYVVPEEYLGCDMDLILTDDVAAFYSFENGEGVRIANRNIIQNLRDIFDLAKQAGRRVDLNEYIARLIEKKGGM